MRYNARIVRINAYNNGDFDEIVGTGDIQIERMADNHFFIGLGLANINLYSIAQIYGSYELNSHEAEEIRDEGEYNPDDEGGEPIHCGKCDSPGRILTDIDGKEFIVSDAVPVIRKLQERVKQLEGMIEQLREGTLRERGCVREVYMTCGNAWCPVHHPDTFLKSRGYRPRK